MKSRTTEGPASRPKRRRVIWAVGALAFLALLIFALAAYFTSARFLVPRLQRELAEALNVPVEVKGLRASIFGESRVERIECAMPTPEWKGVGPFLVLRDVRVALDPKSLLRGAPEVRYVHVGGVGAHVSRDVIERLEQISRRPHGKAVHWPDVRVDKVVADVVLPHYVEPFRIADGWFQSAASGDRRYRGQGAFQVGENRFSLHLQGDPTTREMTLTLRARDAEIARLPRPTVAVAQEQLRGCTVKGRLSGALTLSVLPGQDTPPEWSVDVRLEGGAIRRAAPAFAVTQISGRCRADRTGVRLDDLTARVAGGRISLEAARIGIGAGERVTLSARGQASRVQLDALRAADLFPEATRWLLENQVAGGTLDATFSIGRHTAWSYDVSVEVQDARAVPKLLPVPLNDVRARVRLTPGWIEIEQAQSAVFSGLARASGVLRAGAMSRFSQATVQFTGLAVNEAQRNDLPPQAQELLQKIGVESGAVDATVALANEEVRVHAHVRDAALMPPAMPYRWSNVSGDIFWRSGSSQVEFANVQARHRGGVIAGSGQLSLGPPLKLNALVEADSIPIDGDLLSLLPKDLRDRMAVEPAGVFSMTLNIFEKSLAVPSRWPDALNGVSALIRLRGVSLAHPSAGTFLDRLSGAVNVNEQVILAPALYGKVFGMEATLSGSADLRQTPPRLFAALRSEGNRLSPGLLANWPQGIGSRVAAYQPSGEFDVSASAATDVEAPEKVRGSVALSLHDVEVSLGGRTVQMSGEARINADNLLQVHPAAQATLHLGYIESGGFYVKDLRSDVNIEEERVEIRRLRMQLSGGEVTVREGQVNLSDGCWRARALVEHLDLKSFLASAGMRGREASSGAVRGYADLQGVGFDRRAVRGKGRLAISGGRLYEVPVIASVLSVFQLALPSEGAISDAFVRYRIENATLHLDDMLLSGGPIPIHITGSVGISDEVAGRDEPLDLVISMARGKSLFNEIPIIGWLKRQSLDRFRSQIVQARVTGTVGNYRVESLLSILAAPITRMWDLLQRLPAQGAQGVEGLLGGGKGEQ